MAKPASMRKSLMVNKRLQFMFVGYTLLITWCAMATFFVISQSMKMSGQGLSDSFTAVDSFAITICVSSLVLAILFGFLFSNHIAGPIYRIKTHIDQITKGKAPTQVTLRQGDFHDDLAVSVNRMIDLYSQGGLSGNVHPDFKGEISNATKI